MSQPVHTYPLQTDFHLCVLEPVNRNEIKLIVTKYEIN
jgi:hypothetical protein